jgi:hypothetical protein
MRLRLLKFCFLLTTAVIITVAPWLLIVHDPCFTPYQCEQLQFGMTEAEVTAILGRPPGDYTGGQGYYAHVFGGYYAAGSQLPNQRSWYGNIGAIEAYFDRDDKLYGKDYWPALNPPPTFLERVRGWIGLPVRDESKSQNLVTSA